MGPQWESLTKMKESDLLKFCKEQANLMYSGE